MLNGRASEQRKGGDLFQKVKSESDVGDKDTCSKQRTV